MRYTYDKDKQQWVEILGADKLSMRELGSLYRGEQREMFATAASVVDACNLLDRHDMAIDATNADEVDRLTLGQWDWLRQSIIASARDEALDPEA
jgi:hypothetical protein